MCAQTVVINVWFISYPDCSAWAPITVISKQCGCFHLLLSLTFTISPVSWLPPESGEFGVRSRWVSQNLFLLLTFIFNEVVCYDMRNDFSVDCKIWQDRYSSLTIQLCINYAAFLKVESVKYSFKSALHTHQWNICKYTTQWKKSSGTEVVYFLWGFLYTCGVFSGCLGGVCWMGEEGGGSWWSPQKLGQGPCCACQAGASVD